MLICFKSEFDWGGVKFEIAWKLANEMNVEVWEDEVFWSERDIECFYKYV